MQWSWLNMSCFDKSTLFLIMFISFMCQKIITRSTWSIASQGTGGRLTSLLFLQSFLSLLEDNCDICIFPVISNFPWSTWHFKDGVKELCNDVGQLPQQYWMHVYIQLLKLWADPSSSTMGSTWIPLGPGSWEGPGTGSRPLLVKTEAKKAPSTLVFSISFVTSPSTYSATDPHFYYSSFCFTYKISCDPSGPLPVWILTELLLSNSFAISSSIISVILLDSLSLLPPSVHLLFHIWDQLAIPH